MDPQDRMTAEELKAMQGSSWAAIILAVLGFAAAAVFGGMFFINYSEVKLAKKVAEDAQTQHSTETGQLNETLARFEEELNNKREEIDGLNQQLRDAKFRMQEEKNRADTLGEKIEEQKSRIKILESGSEALVKMRADIAEKDVRLSAIEDEVQKTRAYLAQAQTNLSNSKAENQKLEKDIDRLRTDLKNAQERVTSASVDKAAKDVLQTQLRDKDKQLDEMKEKVRKYEEALENRDKEIGTLRETLGKSGKEAEELQKAKEGLSERDREIGRKDAEIQGLNDKVGKLEEKNETYEREMLALRNTLAQRGDVSEQVKSLSAAVADRDQSIRKKDEKIAALEEELAKSLEGQKTTAEAGEVKSTDLQKQLEEKTEEVTNLQQGLEKLQNENRDLYSRLRLEERATTMVEEGEEIEQVKIISSIWRAGNSMSVNSSDGILPSQTIDLEKDLDLEMGKAILRLETIASARFGFQLVYEELTFAGRSVLPADRNFNDAVFDAGHTVDSEFYVQQIGLGLMSNLGALHKSDTRRIDLGLLLGGKYLKANVRMLDRADGDRTSNNLDAPLPFVGLRLSGRYRDGLIWSVQGKAMNYKYGDHHLRDLVEARVAFGFEIMKSFSVEFGYAYSNTIFKYLDEDDNESFLLKLNSEGPYLSFILTF